jgi:hypothetical protein
MTGWIDYYKVGLEQSERLNTGTLEKFDIPRGMNIENGFIRYTLQQYIAKSKAGIRRPTSAYERILSDVPIEIDAYLAEFSVKRIRKIFT